MNILNHLFWILKPEGIQWLITTGGLPVICLVIFAETGFFAFLPGDSLLVLAGIFAATPAPEGGMLLPIQALLTIVPVCAGLGDQVGFIIGKWFGHAMYSWKDLYLLGIPVYKGVYLKRAKALYERWGVFAIVVGRWVPLGRTFAPIVAGITEMSLKKFLTFNMIGAFTWVWSMVLVGYFLGDIAKKRFNFPLEDHIDKIVIAIVLLSILPILYTAWKESHEDPQSEDEGLN